MELLDKVKRLQNPSKDLRCLSNQLKSHFRELEGFHLVDKDAEDLGEHEFALQWIADDQRVGVSDSDQLEEIFHTHNIQSRIPRFAVLARPADIAAAREQLEMRRSSLRESE